jgi:hypothetical protein
MKTKIVAAVMVLAFAGAAQAGSTGAGPGGTGSLATGTLVSPATLSEALFGTGAPGQSGSIGLSSAQASEMGAYLSKVDGAVVAGSTITVDSAFPSGGRFRLTLDTASATLTLTRL